MNRSKMYISALFILILTLAACSVGRVDMFNTTQLTAPPATEVDIDIGDGLITREDPSTPLSDTFYVTLTKKPSSSVTIGTITSTDTSEVTVSPASLTFTESNWDVPQLVTVTGVDDAVQDGLQPVVIDLGITSSSDNDWDGLSPDNVTVYNLDDETGSVSPAVIVIIGDGLITREDPVTPLSDTFNVVLNSAPSADVTLGTIVSMDTGEVTVSPSSLTFTTLNWDTPRTVTVTGVDDAILDDVQSVTIDLGATSSTDGAWNNLDPGDVITHNLDDETSAVPGVTVSAGSSMLVSESGTASSFAVVLDSMPSNNVSINVSVSDTTEGTITSPFSGTAGTISFTTATWNIPQTITVQGKDDFASDGNQPFLIVLGATISTDPVYNGTFDPADVSFNNVDDDSAGVTVNAGSTMLVSESGTISSFELVLNSQPLNDVSIIVSISDSSEGTVAAPFAGSSGTTTFTSGNWNTPQTITVQGVDDNEADGIQAFLVVLGATSSTDPVYNTTFDPADVSFNNVDDDGAGVTVNAGSAMLVSESGTTSSFEIVLNSQPTTSVDISVSASDSSEGTITAPFTGNSGTVTFTIGNWNIKQAITIQGVDDAAVDGNQPFLIVLGTTSSADANYNGVFNPPDVSFINIDDDSAAPAGVSVNAGSQLLVSENPIAPGASFEVVLNSQPTNDVTINVSTGDNTEGTIAAPFAADSGTVTFTNGNWNVPQTITIIGLDDAEADLNQPFSIVLGTTSSTDPAYNGTINPPDVSFTNVDDDTAGVTVSAGSAMLVSEGGTVSSFEIVLNSEPSDDVTINVSTGDNTEGTISAPFAADSGTLTFTNGNWNIPRTVTVQGVDDAPADGNQPFSIVLGTTSSTDPVYNGTFNPPDVSFTNIDNDASAATVFVSAGSQMLVTESGTVSSFEITLGSQPTADVTINVSTGDNTEGTIAAPFSADSGTLTFTNGNWNLPQTVTVQGIDDFETDGNQSFTIVLGTTSSADPAYNGTINPPDVSFTNVDDDTPGVVVNAGSQMLVSESGTVSSFEIMLSSQPANDVTINVSTGDNTEGTIAAPFAADSGTLTFTNGNWDLPQTVTVQGVDDAAADGNQIFTIVLGITSSADPAYNGTFDPDDVLFINVDDDTIGITVDIGDGLITREDPASPLSDTFKVVLNTQPTADVTFPVISSSDTAEVTVLPASLIFTTATWSFPQTVTVTGVDDLFADDMQTVTIDLGTASGGDYNGFDPGDVTVYNIDDESPAGIIVLNTLNGFITTENGASTEIRVLLSAQPANNVTLGTIQSLDTNEGVVTSPLNITFTPTDWDCPKTIIVTGVDDSIVDPDFVYDIDLGTTLSADPNWDNIDPGDVPITNMALKDILDYALIYPAGTFNTITGTGSVVTFHSVAPATYLDNDEGYAFVPIGFTFYYVGMPFTEMTVYSNGFAAFNPLVNIINNFANTYLFDSGGIADDYINILAPWWDDLTLTSGVAYYETTGTAPNRVFTIEWEKADQIPDNDTYTFQIKLYESTNIIEFVYGNKIAGSSGSSASIGIKDYIGGSGHFIEGLTGKTTAPPPIPDSTFADFPVIDTVIRYTP